jgi:hypothetical protein
VITIEEPVAERHDHWQHHRGHHHHRHRRDGRSRSRLQRLTHSLVHLAGTVAMLAIAIGVAAWAVGFALDQF